MNAQPNSLEPQYRLTIIHLAVILIGVLALHLFLRTYAGPRMLMGNVDWWRAMAAAMHKHGFFNVWTPYPPVFPTLFYGLYRLAPGSAIIPVWQAFNVCLLLGQAALVLAIVRRLSPQNGHGQPHAGLIAAFAFLVVMIQPRSLVLLGPWMDQFDYLPTFLLLLGLYLLIKQRRSASAVVCGIGIMTKLFPGVLVLVALASLGLKRGLRYAAIAAGVCVIIAAPFFIVNRPAFLSTYRWSAHRTPWESVWAYAFPGRLSRDPLANLPEAAHSPDLIEIQFAEPFSTPADTTDEPGIVITRPQLVTILTTSLMAVGMVLATVLLARRKRAGPDTLIRGALILVLIFMICSKGFSSYFIVWAAPLVCIAYPGAVGFALCAAMIVLSNTEMMGVFARFAEMQGNEQNFRHFSRLGSPYVLFWRSIVYREMLLIVIAGHQIMKLWKSREIIE
ncbi:MAG: DUF2029 domain-containing protein [Planctomycetes bacterium]|nr:DUF2029 domain-containing protein [Planctomycetota bacterium]